MVAKLPMLTLLPLWETMAIGATLIRQGMHLIVFYIDHSFSFSESRAGKIASTYLPKNFSISPLLNRRLEPTHFILPPVRIEFSSIDAMTKPYEWLLRKH